MSSHSSTHSTPSTSSLSGDTPHTAVGDNDLVGSSHGDCAPSSTTSHQQDVKHVRFPSHWSAQEALPSSSTISCFVSPFLSRISHYVPNSNSFHLWESRRHRKRLPQPITSAKDTKDVSEMWKKKKAQHIRTFWPWRPNNIAYWTAVLFDVGSLCFVLSSIGAFIPNVYNSTTTDTDLVGWVAFAGSALFTAGSFAMVTEVLKAPEFVDSVKAGRTGHALTWHLLYRIDFYIAFLQLIGAMAFNVNTFSFTGQFVLTQEQTIGLVDFCDIFASCCFTLSGYLSVVEVTHSILPFSLDHFARTLISLEYWVSIMDWLGGMGFLANGVSIIYYPNPGQIQANYSLFLGSVFFQIGSHLQYIEQGEAHENVDDKKPQEKGQQSASKADVVSPPQNDHTNGDESSHDR